MPRTTKPTTSHQGNTVPHPANAAPEAHVHHSALTHLMPTHSRTTTHTRAGEHGLRGPPVQAGAAVRAGAGSQPQHRDGLQRACRSGRLGGTWCSEHCLLLLLACNASAPPGSPHSGLERKCMAHLTMEPTTPLPTLLPTQIISGISTATETVCGQAYGERGGQRHIHPSALASLFPASPPRSLAPHSPPPHPPPPAMPPPPARRRQELQRPQRDAAARAAHLRGRVRAHRPVVEQLGGPADAPGAAAEHSARGREVRACCGREPTGCADAPGGSRSSRTADGSVPARLLFVIPDQGIKSSQGGEGVAKARQERRRLLVSRPPMWWAYPVKHLTGCATDPCICCCHKPPQPPSLPPPAATSTS